MCVHRIIDERNVKPSKGKTGKIEKRYQNTKVEYAIDDSKAEDYEFLILRTTVLFLSLLAVPPLQQTNNLATAESKDHPPHQP